MNAPSSLSATARDQSALQAELTAALSQIVSDDALLWEREDTTPYECDGLAAYRQVPLAVVLPDTEAQVVEIPRAIAMDGTCTGEHGVGLHKMDFLIAEHGNDAIDLMRSIKQALDPKHILNPGKIFHL